METIETSFTTRLKKYSVFGLNYSITNYREASDLIIRHACVRNSFTVAALPVHGLIESYKYERYRKVANNIDMVVPDGFPIIWALNRMYNLNLKERICGMDLTLHVLEKASKLSLKVFLYGSYETTIQKFSEFINKRYPGVTICGTHPDRFRESTPEEDLLDIETINKSGAQIVLVGRGCPRQEYWIDAHKNKINAAMMAIGGAFDVHSQTIKRAPKWMRDRGLEWFYRLMAEPGRMWKRYLFTNSLYIFLMAKYNLGRMISKNL
jgi:N-acetylglucosaminyldiphosphoundecaprenol N-acetyl-beta-D-mannosaminyltransferase